MRGKPCEIKIECLRELNYTYFVNGLGEGESGDLWNAAVFYSKSHKSYIYDCQVKAVTQILNTQALSRTDQFATNSKSGKNFEQVVLSPTRCYIETAKYSTDQTNLNNTLTSGLSKAVIMLMKTTTNIKSPLDLSGFNSSTKRIIARAGCRVTQPPIFV